MRLSWVCLISIIAPAVNAADFANTSSCASRLDRTLAVMQDRPLLKEEHATALMWLRMDAREAITRGDEAECVAKVAVAETLLSIGGQEK